MIFPKWTTYLWLLSLVEEFVLALGLLRLLLAKVTVLADGLDDLLVDPLEIDLRTRRDDVTGVHSPERDAIDFVGTGNEQNTLGEVLEENDALATEAAGEEDDDSPGGERGPSGGRADGFADLLE